MNETIFFDGGGVKVTNARFIVHAQTYAMNGVTSVKSLVIPPNRGGAIIGILIGLAILFAASGGTKLLGVAVIAGCAWFLTQLKDTHVVVLSSASGEVKALEAQDSEFIGGVIAALNDALIHRG
jgi:hypothetical protein